MRRARSEAKAARRAGCGGVCREQGEVGRGAARWVRARGVAARALTMRVSYGVCRNDAEPCSHLGALRCSSAPASVYVSQRRLASSTRTTTATRSPRAAAGLKVLTTRNRVTACCCRLPDGATPELPFFRLANGISTAWRRLRVCACECTPRRRRTRRARALRNGRGAVVPIAGTEGRERAW